jgi:hypothetical protein
MALVGVALWNTRPTPSAPATIGYIGPPQPCWRYAALIQLLGGDGDEAAITFAKADAAVMEGCALDSGPLFLQYEKKTGLPRSEIRKRVRAVAAQLRKKHG